MCLIQRFKSLYAPSEILSSKYGGQVLETIADYAVLI